MENMKLNENNVEEAIMGDSEFSNEEGVPEYNNDIIYASWP